jgi:hypothetical protein
MIRALEVSAFAASCCALTGCFILFHDGDGTGGAGGLGTSSTASGNVTSTAQGATVAASVDASAANTTVGGMPASSGLSSSTGGVSDCTAANGNCVAAPPAGWTGPVIEKDASTTCDFGTTIAFAGGTAASAGQGPCVCAPSGVPCEISGVKLDATDGTCTSETPVPTLIENTCQLFNAGSTVRAFDVTALPNSSLSCIPGAQSPPTPQYTQDVVLCSIPSQANACPIPDVCAPQGNACVFHQGDMPCVAPYLVHKSSPIKVSLSCTCTQPVPALCGGNILVYTNACGPTPQPNSFDVTNSNCDAFTGNANLWLKYVPEKEPSCGTTGAWAATGTQDTTVCCLN